MPLTDAYVPDPRYLDLGEGFADAVEPARFPAHLLRFRNQRWAAAIGLDALTDGEWIAHLARFEPLPRNFPEPLAQRYHGHQFGSYNPELGDGRGFTFAQVRGRDGRLLDLGTKGSGRTPYSRGGDGRLTLKGGVREILATEMLESLGVPTSKTLSVVETGERLQRHDEPSPTRACVLVRLGWSHIRVGTFQRHAYERRPERIQRLTEHVVEHYYPELDDADPARFLLAFSKRLAETGARWMAAGFVHGVLNTDNIAITAESFDYGPWRFLPRYDPRFTAAYFDQTGYYAYGAQLGALRFDLTQLATSLRVGYPQAELTPIVEAFPDEARRRTTRAMLDRLGLRPRDPDTDEATVDALLRYLQSSEVAFAQLFHDWFGGEASEARAEAGPNAARYARRDFLPLREAMSRHEPAHPEQLADPHYQRPYAADMRIEEVEEIWSRIDQLDDWSALHWKVADLRRRPRFVTPGA